MCRRENVVRRGALTDAIYAEERLDGHNIFGPLVLYPLQGARVNDLHDLRVA